MPKGPVWDTTIEEERRAGADAGSDGEGPAYRLGLGPTGMLGRVEGARRGGRRIDATIKEETL